MIGCLIEKDMRKINLLFKIVGRNKQLETWKK
jgi:hypothetical protein